LGKKNRKRPERNLYMKRRKPLKRRATIRLNGFPPPGSKPVLVYCPPPHPHLWIGDKKMCFGFIDNRRDHKKLLRMVKALLKATEK